MQHRTQKHRYSYMPFFITLYSSNVQIANQQSVNRPAFSQPEWMVQFINVAACLVLKAENGTGIVYVCKLTVFRLQDEKVTNCLLLSTTSGFVCFAGVLLHFIFIWQNHCLTKYMGICN